MYRGIYKSQKNRILILSKLVFYLELYILIIFRLVFMPEIFILIFSDWFLCSQYSFVWFIYIFICWRVLSTTSHLYRWLTELFIDNIFIIFVIWILARSEKDVENSVRTHTYPWVFDKDRKLNVLNVSFQGITC